MTLKAGDKLSLAQDEEDPRCFYFFKDAEHGFPVSTSSKGKVLRFAHKGFFTLIAETLELPGDKNAKGMIAGQATVMKGDKAGTQYWGILIRSSV